MYPFEEPGIGPNNYRFDDNVLYQIHVALGKDVDKGKPTISYQFQFKTEFINKQTILQSFLGPLNGDDNDGDGLVDEDPKMYYHPFTNLMEYRYGRDIDFDGINENTTFDCVCTSIISGLSSGLFCL